MYTIGVGSELSIDQGEEDLVSKAVTQRYKSIVSHMSRINRYDIRDGVNHLAKAMLNQLKAHMEAANHVLCYLAGSIDFSITYLQGGVRLTVCSNVY